MESLLFMFNSIAIVLLSYMSLRDERRARGEPQTSFFRMTKMEVAPAATTDPSQTPVPDSQAPAWAEWAASDERGSTGQAAGELGPAR